MTKFKWIEGGVCEGEGSVESYPYKFNEDFNAKSITNETEIHNGIENVSINIRLLLMTLQLLQD